jgi:hypothetical protein
MSFPDPCVVDVQMPAGGGPRVLFTAVAAHAELSPHEVKTVAV